MARSINSQLPPTPPFVYPNDGKVRAKINSLTGQQPRKRRGKLNPIPPTGPPLATAPARSDTGKFGPLKIKVP